MKICLVAHAAYGTLTGQETGHIGGVERQAALFSEWLSTRGHDVSVITWDEGGQIAKVGKVRIIKLCKQEDGIPGLRFFSPRWSSLVRALRKADAEIYYHNCAEYVTGQVALWCKLNNRYFVYSIASDADCRRNLPDLQHWRERLLYRIGLKNADLVISQTHHQKRILNDNFGVKATVIRMPGTPPVHDYQVTDEDRFHQRRIIWVARIHPVKRIQWVIDIANELPQFAFEIIGPMEGSQPNARLISQRLNDTANITSVGRVKRSEMPKHYQLASLLCCTSSYEGFPNTFLEAWSYGVPVVSTVDPDDIIMINRLGFASGSKVKLVEAIKSILEDQLYWKELSNNASEYFLANHQFERIQRQFEDHLKKLYQLGDGSARCS